jgi:hypothetical protein
MVFLPTVAVRSSRASVGSRVACDGETNEEKEGPRLSLSENVVLRRVEADSEGAVADVACSVVDTGEWAVAKERWMQVG